MIPSSHVTAVSVKSPPLPGGCLPRAEEALRQSNAELQSYTEELARFNRAAVGHELRIIELKKEVNELCRRQDQAARYPLKFEQEGQDADTYESDQR